MVILRKIIPVLLILIKARASMVMTGATASSYNAWSGTSAANTIDRVLAFHYDSTGDWLNTIYKSLGTSGDYWCAALDSEYLINAVFFSARETFKQVSNVGLQFRVGKNHNDPWSNPICLETDTDVDSFWFQCGLSGDRFCVTRDPSSSDIIEFFEIVAYTEYFIQHKYFKTWSSALVGDSLVENMLQTHVNLQTGSSSTGFLTHAINEPFPTEISFLERSNTLEDAGWFVV